MQAEQLKALAENEPEKAMLESIQADLEEPIESHPHSPSTFFHRSTPNILNVLDELDLCKLC